MVLSPKIAVIAGALLTAIVAIAGSGMTGRTFAGDLNVAASAAIHHAGGSGVRARFATANGWPSRHPELSGGKKLDEGVRAKVARAVAGIGGVGGIRWADGSNMAQGIADEPLTPMHCQDEVQALLRARTVRFEESSSEIQSASQELLDEVAQALRPCLGSIIAITGHTDNSGPEPANLELSRERAIAVENALAARRIPRDGMRARGFGSRSPVEGLAPADPANRRIDFSVIATKPLAPTPVDTPGPR